MKYFLISNSNQNVNLSEKVFQSFQHTKDFVNQSVNSVTKSVQQTGESLQKTANQATTQAIDTVSATFGQAKVSVEQTLQSAQQVKSTTSVAVQTAVSTSISHWIEQHPTILRLIQILGWAVNHPIISLVILLFTLAIAWNLIKIIGRFIESTSLALLLVPFKFLKFCFSGVIKLGEWIAKQLTNSQKTDDVLPLSSTISEQIQEDKHQRLVEISTRLEEIQQEQNQLLQEAAEILAGEKIVMKTGLIHYLGEDYAP